MKKIVIMVAAHKKYHMPADSVYLPVQVGAEGKPELGYVRDNTGDNISVKNPNYCELTGLYWLWKNVDADYIGLVHYRRYFVARRSRNKWERIARRKDYAKLLKTTNVILPKKRHYFIESNYSQYIHAHHAADLDITREIIFEKYPEYIPAYDTCMKRTSGHKFNMFVMKKSLADAYCSWLFDILFELEERLDISTYSENDSRVFGFVAERLLDVWIETNKIPYKEMKVCFMEKQNWIKKSGDFLARKFGLNLANVEDDSQHLLKSGFSQSKGTFQLTSRELKQLKSVLIEMLNDFVHVADKYSLNYTMSGGSVLGAVRHHGFIPWDDDIDINIPRKDFNRFAKVFEQELGDKYILCAPEITENHGLTVAQIKKKGTVYRSFNELSKDEAHCGICIDLFVIENTFNNFIIRNIHGIVSLAFGYLCTCRKTYNDLAYLLPYLEKDTEAEKEFRKKARIGNAFRWIPLDWITKMTVKVYSCCTNNKSKYVTIPTGRKHFFGEMQLRSDLCDTIDEEFEKIPVKLPKGCKKYLKALYGENFMKLPPVEKRETHPLMELKFET